MLACLHEERFQDRSPAADPATLLDEGHYHCSLRTMYRILEQEGETGERRDQLTHPAYQKPELLATAPNQLWSWDITKLKGPAKWTYFYLYVILDVFSRYVVGWMVAPRETAELAKRLIADTCDKQNIQPGQVDDPRRSRLGHDVQAGGIPVGRPERHQIPQPPLCFRRQPLFGKPLSHPEIPAGVSRNGLAASRTARAFCQTFFAWYNEEHRHSGIGCSPLPWCTTARRAVGDQPAGRAQRRVPGSPGALRAPAPKLLAIPRRSGSTNPTQRIKLSKFLQGVSQIIDTRRQHRTASQFAGISRAGAGDVDRRLSGCALPFELQFADKAGRRACQGDPAGVACGHDLDNRAALLPIPIRSSKGKGRNKRVRTRDHSILPHSDLYGSTELSPKLLGPITPRYTLCRTGTKYRAGHHIWPVGELIRVPNA